MTLESDIETLKKVGFFQEFQPDPLRLLAFSADSREYADRAVLFDEGDVADCGYVIISGRIDLTRTEHGQHRLLMSLGPSTLIGELALIIDTTRAARAVSVGRSRVMLIRRTTFRRVLQEYPDIATILSEKIATRLGGIAPELDRIREELEEEGGQ
jgi:CRP-like cAMP-binding protein